MHVVSLLTIRGNTWFPYLLLGEHVVSLLTIRGNTMMTYVSNTRGKESTGVFRGIWSCPLAYFSRGKLTGD